MPSPVVVQRLSYCQNSPEEEEQNKIKKKMKGLFKSKPKTPADLVRQTRDLLIIADRNPNNRDTKREDKVRFHCFPIRSILSRLLLILFYPIILFCLNMLEEFDTCVYFLQNHVQLRKVLIINT